MSHGKKKKVSGFPFLLLFVQLRTTGAFVKSEYIISFPFLSLFLLRSLSLSENGRYGLENMCGFIRSKGYI